MGTMSYILETVRATTGKGYRQLEIHAHAGVIRHNSMRHPSPSEINASCERTHLLSNLAAVNFPTYYIQQ